MHPMALALKDVEEAAARIAGAVVHTPLVEVEPGVHLKLENLQRTGAFKIRGATNAVRSLAPQDLARGVSCVSAGNHGLALAVAARARGAKARVYVPDHAVQRKVDAIRAEGAEVIAAPSARLGEILAANDAGDGTTFVSPFADARVAAGNGTVGLEIARALPEARTVLLQIGGGGLALGSATAIRALLPHARCYGVVAENSRAVSSAWETGRAEPTKPTSVADGLGAPIASLAVVNALKERLEGLLTVTDAQILAGMRALALAGKIVAEPAGAASYAAAMAHPELPRPVVAIVSGGNVDPALLARVLGE